MPDEVPRASTVLCDQKSHFEDILKVEYRPGRSPGSQDEARKAKMTQAYCFVRAPGRVRSATNHCGH